MAEATRILHIVEASFAGVGRHVLDLAHEQARRGHEVHVAYSGVRESASFRSEREASTTVLFHQVDLTRSIGWRDGRGALALQRLVRNLRPDVMHGHSTKGGLMARLVPRRNAKVAYTPNAVYSMNPLLSRRARSFVATAERLLSKRTDTIIAVSPEEQDHLASIGVAPELVSLVPNGIGEVEPADSTSVRTALSLPSAAVVFGFVGRLDDQKAPLDLIAAFSEIAAGHPEAHLAVVGDGPLFEDLVDARERAALHDRIHLLGEQPGRWAMASFDVFVLPSRYEGFPYVLIEAAKARLPIITTSAACARQLITSPGHGRVIENGDIEALAEAMHELTSETARRESGAAVQAEAARFTIAAMADGVASALAP